MVDDNSNDSQASSAAAAPALTAVQRRDRQRLDTLTILEDPTWPGDGSTVQSTPLAASWWCLGAAILLAFPRQYVAAIMALVLALLLRMVHEIARRRAQAVPVARVDKSPVSE